MTELGGSRVDSNFLINLYRNRLYGPLLLLVLAYLLLPKFRRILHRAADRVNQTGEKVLTGILFAISLLLSLCMIYQGKSWGGDYSQYFAQARALATGTLDSWYQKNSFIIFNSVPGAIGSDVYPWLWAILLLPFQLTIGLEAYTVLKIYSSFYLAGAVALLFAIFRRRLQPSKAFFLTCFLALNANYLFDINALDSDIPGFFFVVLSIFFIDRYLENRKLHLAVFSGVTMFLAVQCRSMSMTLLLALVCFDLLQTAALIVRRNVTRSKIWKNLGIVILPYLTYGVLTGIVNAILPRAGGTYGSYFTLDRSTLAFNLQTYFDVFSSYFGSDVNASSHLLMHVIFLAVLITAIIGMVLTFVRQAKQGERHLDPDLFLIIFSCGTMVMLLLYEFFRTAFTFSVFPFLLLFSEMGFAALQRCIRNLPVRDFFRNAVAALYIASLIVIFANSCAYIYAVRVRHFALNDVTSEDAVDTFAYIRDNLNEDDVVFFFKPRVLYYYTGVSSYYWFDADHLDLADYVLIGPAGAEEKLMDKVKNPDFYTKVYQNDQFTLYQKNTNS